MIDIEEMIYLWLEIIYDNKRMGLDYGEDIQLLLELDEELEDFYIHNNITDEPIQG